jgi:hypothetical protein
MLTVFRSKAGADILMVGAQAHEVLQALGREPAAQGIFRGEQIDEALRHLTQALAAARESPPEVADADEPAAAALGLQTRAWPLRALLEAARARECDVTWTSA